MSSTASVTLANFYQPLEVAYRWDHDSDEQYGAAFYRETVIAEVVRDGFWHVIWYGFGGSHTGIKIRPEELLWTKVQAQRQVDKLIQQAVVSL
jgi:hypothetical protein